MTADSILLTQTPNGHQIGLVGRTGTADNAVANGVLGEDEYQLQGHSWSGWAIDVGAYTGAVTVALGVDNPGLRIIAVEPVAENAAIVTENARRNGLAERVIVECAAATAPRVKSVTLPYAYRSVGIEGGKGGPIVPPGYVADTRMMAGLFHYPAGEMDAETLTVPGLSLSAILRKYAIDRVALLKIDCEGCEWQFLTDRAIGRVDEIVGEYHSEPAVDGLADLLAATHEVSHLRVDAPDFGIFRAVRRERIGGPS